MDEYFKSPPLYRLLLVPGLIVAGIVISFCLIVWPSLDAITANRDEINQLNQRLTKLTDKVQALANIDPAVQRTQLLLADSAVPSTKETIETMNNLFSLANQSSVSLDTLQSAPGLISSTSAKPVNSGNSPLPSPAAAENKPVLFNVDFSGNQDQISRFMASLEHFLLPVVIPLTLEFRNSGAKTEATTTIQLLWQALPKTFGGEDVPVATLTSQDQQTLTTIQNVAAIPPPTQLNVSSSSGVKTTLF
jgi:hypothetical protein